VPLFLLASLIFIDASIKKQSILIGAIATFMSFIQLYGYGFGFLNAFLTPNKNIA
jgi:hypothetical protein